MFSMNRRWFFAIKASLLKAGGHRKGQKQFWPSLWPLASKAGICSKEPSPLYAEHFGISYVVVGLSVFTNTEQEDPALALYISI